MEQSLKLDEVLTAEDIREAGSTDAEPEASFEQVAFFPSKRTATVAAGANDDIEEPEEIAPRPVPTRIPSLAGASLMPMPLEETGLALGAELRRPRRVERPRVRTPVLPDENLTTSSAEHQTWVEEIDIARFAKRMRLRWDMTRRMAGPASWCHAASNTDQECPGEEEAKARRLIADFEQVAHKVGPDTPMRAAFVRAVEACAEPGYLAPWLSHLLMALLQNRPIDFYEQALAALERKQRVAQASEKRLYALLEPAFRLLWDEATLDQLFPASTGTAQPGLIAESPKYGLSASGTTMLPSAC